MPWEETWPPPPGCIRPTCVSPIPYGNQMDRRTDMKTVNSDVSRVSDISVSAYLRTEGGSGGGNRNDMGNDLFLGGIKCVLLLTSQPSDR